MNWRARVKGAVFKALAFDLSPSFLLEGRRAAAAPTLRTGSLFVILTLAGRGGHSLIRR
jgi:hypothetical protein